MHGTNNIKLKSYNGLNSDPGDRAVEGVGLRQLACWECGCESCRGHGSLVQRSPTECGESECVQDASIINKSGPTRGCCAVEWAQRNRFCNIRSQFETKKEEQAAWTWIWLHTICPDHRSQWPRGLRRRFSAAGLLRLWVRIPLGHERLSVVNVVCCHVEVSATDWSLIQRSPTDCGASLCVIKKPRKRGG